MSNPTIIANIDILIAKYREWVNEDPGSLWADWFNETIVALEELQSLRRSSGTGEAGGCTCLPLPEPPSDDCPLHGEHVTAPAHDAGVTEATLLQRAHDVLNHALMALPFPAGGAQQRAWTNMIDARDELAAALAAGPAAGEQKP